MSVIIYSRTIIAASLSKTSLDAKLLPREAAAFLWA